MPVLSQFLSLLANEIRQGKTLADLDTARQSARFLKDDFLRLLPISRIDLDQVRLRFKMAVAEVVMTPDDSPFLSELVEQLAAQIIKIPDKLWKAEKLSAEVLSSPIVEAAARALVPELSELDPSRITLIRETLAKRFANHFAGRLAKLLPNSTAVFKRQTLKAAMETFARIFDRYAELYKEDLAAQLLKELGRLDVVVEGQRLREFPPDTLVELELHLVPKTYHWSLKPEFIDNPDAPPEKRYTLMPGS